MEPIEKRALDLLCGECDMDPEDYCTGLTINVEEALRAIIAALTPPEELVLVERRFLEMIVDRHADYGGEGYAHDEAADLAEKMLSARPEVK